MGYWGDLKDDDEGMAPAPVARATAGGAEDEWVKQLLALSEKSASDELEQLRIIAHLAMGQVTLQGEAGPCAVDGPSRKALALRLSNWIERYERPRLDAGGTTVARVRYTDEPPERTAPVENASASCRRCGYELRGGVILIPAGRCPSCGGAMVRR